MPCPYTSQSPAIIFSTSENARLKALLCSPLQSLRLGRCVRRTVRQAIQAVNRGGTSDLNEQHRLGIARLEAHRGSRRNIQAHSVCRRAIESQGAIYLKKMKMRTDLNGPIARIGDFQFDFPAPFIGN